MDRLIGKTSSISSYVDQSERKIYVDTVGYGDIRFKTDMKSFILFFRELICHASTGYNWLFLVLRYERLTLDILIYLELLEQLLGDNVLGRCTIVFTHCKTKDMNRERCLAANRDFPRIVQMLEKAHSMIFGDMDTYEDADSDVDTRELISQNQAKRRQRFMEQLLQRIDNTDDNALKLNEPWFRSQWTSFKQYIGYCTEKVFGKSNELSKHYRLIAMLKKEIPITIYYESCSICLELIVEVSDEEPRSCITKCGHIFHYECLKKWFREKKQCPNCRADLRSLPDRIFGKRIGLHPIDDSLKEDFVLSRPVSLTPIPTSRPESVSERLSWRMTAIGEFEDSRSLEESSLS